MKTLSLVVIVALSLSACSTFRRSASAIPLEPNWSQDVKKSENDTARFVAGIIYDSEQKCDIFIAELTASESLSNVGLDMTTTALSALATAFVPLTTVHALSAGAAISSGWKTAVDTDVFAKGTIANYAEAIQLTYYQNMHVLITGLPSDPDERVNASKALAQIQEIHQGCSLGAAQSTIAKTLQDASKASQTDKTQSIDKKLVKVKGPFKNGQSIVIVANSTSSVEPDQITTYTVSGKNSVKDIANAIADSINQKLASSNLSAAVKTSGSTTYVELISPQSSNTKWTIDPNTLFGPITSESQKSTAEPGLVLPGGSLLSK